MFLVRLEFFSPKSVAPGILGLWGSEFSDGALYSQNIVNDVLKSAPEWALGKKQASPETNRLRRMRKFLPGEQKSRETFSKATKKTRKRQRPKIFPLNWTSHLTGSPGIDKVLLKFCCPQRALRDRQVLEKGCNLL
jgi:hypothetical protein